MKKGMKRILMWGTLLMSAVVLAPAHASIVLNNTRIVYAENDREASVKMTNNGSQPVVVQSWIDDGEIKKDPSLMKVPFMLMPPMTRVDPGQGQTLRLMYTGEALPKDRESVYFLNVLEIPPKVTASEDKNFVQVALRTRIKLFYRPSGLKDSANQAPSKLVWSLVQAGFTWGLQCSNPSPYFVSMSEISLNTSGKSSRVGDGMVAPGAKMNIPLESRPNAGTKVTFIAIDDYGAPRENISSLTP
ncbi:putative fimbrial chaperone YadV [Pseudomonas fluorescens]|nr:putative fimbrial chaperone YadV [Pseudomonas fluorescens]